jgi:hypothetical protein
MVTGDVVVELVTVIAMVRGVRGWLMTMEVQAARQR